MKSLPNGIAVVESDTHIGKWVEEAGRLDCDENVLPLILPLIKEGETVVDAGACIGDHTIAYLNAVGDSGEVYAFEPNPFAFKCLEYNCPKAKLNECGLSDRVEGLRMEYSPDGNLGASYVSSNRCMVFCNGQFKVDGKSVLCKPLDSVQLKRLDFIKLDVEGYEIKALKGASKSIEFFRPVMFVEVNEHALARNGSTKDDLIALIENLGYSHKPI